MRPAIFSKVSRALSELLCCQMRAARQKAFRQSAARGAANALTNSVSSKASEVSAGSSGKRNRPSLRARSAHAFKR